jgi:hypothetical protein
MANMDDRLIVRPALNEEISERPGKKREKAPPPLPAWLTCEAHSAPGWRERAGLKEEISERRIESVRRQTLIPPSSACMANMEDRLTGQSQCAWQEGVVVGGS